MKFPLHQVCFEISRKRNRDERGGTILPLQIEFWDPHRKRGDVSYQQKNHDCSEQKWNHGSADPLQGDTGYAAADK
jgi:hypothetical protein